MATPVPVVMGVDGEAVWVETRWRE